MAKNDDKRARTTIATERDRSQNRLDHTFDEQIIPQAQEFWNNAKIANAQSFADYGNLMSGFNNFAKTGGYSPQDLSAIRARSVSPIRSVYANANREVDRGKALSGYSPNYNATKAKMAREQSYATSDAQTNVEAGIADLVNQGKRFGLSGGTSLYGTSPGMASTFGNQALSATKNWLDTQQLQNQLSLGTMGAQTQAAGLQGKWQQVFNNGLNTLNTIGNVAKGFKPVP